MKRIVLLFILFITLSRLNNMIVEKNEEIKNLKDMQVYMWIGFIFIFLLGV